MGTAYSCSCSFLTHWAFLDSLTLQDCLLRYSVCPPEVQGCSSADLSPYLSETENNPVLLHCYAQDVLGSPHHPQAVHNHLLVPFLLGSLTSYAKGLSFTYYRNILTCFVSDVLYCQKTSCKLKSPVRTRTRDCTEYHGKILYFHNS